MKRSIVATAVLLLLACRPDAYHNRFAPWGVTPPLPVPAGYVQAEGDTVAYVLALTYPGEASWRYRSDDAGAAWAVFANQKQILTVPCEGLISSDADRNRLLGGHLYSDAFDGDETVLLRDGRELFRYPGREWMRGIRLQGDSVLTLGQSPAGGFSLRCNGLELFSRASGQVIGPAEAEAGSPGFLYPEGFSYCALDGTPYRVRDAVAEAFPLCEPVARILDARSLGDRFYVAAVRENGSVGIYVDGQRQTGFDLSQARRIYSGALLPGEDGLLFKAAFDLGTAGERLYVWSLSREVLFCAEFIPPLYHAAGRWYYFGTLGDGKDSPYGEKVLLQGTGDRLMGPRCACWKAGHSYAVVTAADPLLYPYLLRDGRRLAIPVNGCLTDLEVIP